MQNTGVSKRKENMASLVKVTWQHIFLIFTSYLHIICEGGELKFCFHGPQRIKYKDCPGGFIAKKSLNTSCLYYFKADGVPNMAATVIYYYIIFRAQFSSNICDPSHQRELDRDFQDFTENDFHLIQFTDIDEEGGETAGSESAPEKCNATCLGEWKELKHWDPVPIFMDKPVVNESEQEQFDKDYVEMTKTIMIRIINEDEYDDEDVENVDPASTNSTPVGAKMDIFQAMSYVDAMFPMPAIMKLLTKSMRIIHKKCEPYIETSFYSLVFRTMTEFRKMNSNFPSINVLPFKRISALLDRCEETPNNIFMLNGTECDEKHVVHSINYMRNSSNIISEKYQAQPNSFRWGRYDPIIEAAWAAVDFVHAFCFDIFAEDMLHYSHYVKAMVEVFIQPKVQKHWTTAAQVGKGMTLWEMAYDTPDIQNQLRSLDACVMAVYKDSIYSRRLERPFTSEDSMKDPQYIDDPAIPPPGWAKSIEEYWRMYEKKGFKEVIGELGYCLQTPQEFNATHKEMMAQHCEEHHAEHHEAPEHIKK